LSNHIHIPPYIIRSYFWIVSGFTI